VESSRDIQRNWVGVVLAGGTGSRLYPVTRVLSKQLLPIYDKPMVYYPLSTLMLAGMREILLISTPEDLPKFRVLLGDGAQLGINIQYAGQDKPRGLAEALIIAAEFAANRNICLVLGDNIFYGQGFTNSLEAALQYEKGATIFAYAVSDPQHYGVVEFDKGGNVLSLEEKPKIPKSSFAIPGIYFYDSSAPILARSLAPSVRGELEITDLNRLYLERGQLRAEKLSRGVAWLDTGTHESLLRASNFVEAIQERQGLRIACLEEIAFRRGFIDERQLRLLAEPLLPSGYGRYLLRMLE
jgi:glucose-1-phosphate thymidylyltransferase